MKTIGVPELVMLFYAMLWMTLIIFLFAITLEPIADACAYAWPRIRCRCGRHRETLIYSGGLLYYRCVDCSTGYLYAGVWAPHVTGLPLALRRRRRRKP